MNSAPSQPDEALAQIPFPANCNIERVFAQVTDSFAMVTPQKSENPTIAYLRRAIDTEKRIERKLELSRRLKDLAMRATSSLSAIRDGGTNSRSKVEDGIVALLDLAEEISAEANCMVADLRNIGVIIKQIGNHKHRAVLEWRYLNGLDWPDIAIGLKIEEDTAKKLHGKALLEFAKMKENFSS